MRRVPVEQARRLGLYLVADRTVPALYLYNPSSEISSVSESEVKPGEGNGCAWVAPISDKTGAKGAWKLVYSEPLDIRFCGNANKSDFSSVIEKAAKSSNYLYVGESLKAGSTRQDLLRDVVFTGDGQLNGVYRKWVVPMNSGSYVAPVSDLVPEQVPRFRSESSPVVVLVGDSISTYNANTTGRGDSLALKLESFSRQQLRPDQTLTFFNRSIGGQTYTAFFGRNSAEAPAPNIAWWDNTRSWKEQVKALNPDILFLSFGMNDSKNIRPDVLDALLDEIESWPSSPNVVLSTNLLPSLGADDPAPGIPAMNLQTLSIREDDTCARADFQTNRS
ncbi:SGNH/GDSL hydrolase family protein [Candidatus Kaiserbacteria bacterium]|nr:SGNH/GDSL hydrolase family protein [Candidatus Kaiserbacteria bacterium]